MKPRTEIDMFRELEIEAIRNYEIVFNVKKNNLDEFEGKVREIESLNENESQQNLIISSRKNQKLDEGRKMVTEDPTVCESLKLKHTVWSDCFIPNTEVIGLVIGVGENSRMKINSKLSKEQKLTCLDYYINYSTMSFFGIMLIIGFLDTVFLGLNKRWHINLFR